MLRRKLQFPFIASWVKRTRIFFTKWEVQDPFTKSKQLDAKIKASELKEDNENLCE